MWALTSDTDTHTHTPHTHTHPHSHTHALIRSEKSAVCSSLFQRQLHLPMQCQPYPWDIKMRFRVNRFGTIECLVARDAFNSGQVDTVPLRIPSLTSNTHDTCSSETKLIEIFHHTVKAENRKFVINRKVISIFQG